MVFADCLAAGYPQFMAASRAMREEGLGQIWKKGVFRINFGLVSDGAVCPRPPQDVFNQIQHLSVRIKGMEKHFAHPCWSEELTIFMAFGGFEVPRKSCKIVYEHEPSTGGRLGGFRNITKTFVGFKEVELRLLNLPCEISDEEKMHLGKKILSA